MGKTLKCVVLKKAFLLYLLFGMFIHINAQSFEGVIRYKSESVTDTAYVTYNIRENLIRVDEANTAGTVTRSTIVNLNQNTVTAIDPHKKMYTDIYPRSQSQFAKSDFEIKRTGNMKKINGYDCYQWRVRNRSANSEVAYWVAEENFEFFDDLLKTLPFVDNSYAFFLTIPKPDGFLPMHVCERTLLRDVKNKYYVLDIQEQAIDQTIFEVPVDYQELQVVR